jgi:transposase
MKNISLLSKKIQYYIGIDISKHKLDCAVIENGLLVQHKIVPNTVADIKAYLQELKELKGYTRAKALFCMESTGIYANFLLRVFFQMKALVVMENALHIKNSFGLIRDKSDKKDAFRIALFAQRNCDQLKLWEQPREIITKLALLSTLRDRLVLVSTMLRTPLKESKNYLVDQLHNVSLQHCQGAIQSVKSDIKVLEQEIDRIIADDPFLALVNKQMTSVPGIGKFTALQVIITTNEFKKISDPRKFACYAGIAPFKFESGQSTSRARVSAIANKKMKTLLHICAVRAIRVDAELKNYYLRKTTVGNKPKMLVINAIRNKLILRLFACVKQDKLFVKNERLSNDVA